MNDPQSQPSPEESLPEVDSSDTILVIMDGPADTTRRPMTPEEIAAMKRFWERQGRKPPPPYDKL